MPRPQLALHQIRWLVAHRPHAGARCIAATPANGQGRSRRRSSDSGALGPRHTHTRSRPSRRPAHTRTRTHPTDCHTKPRREARPAPQIGACSGGPGEPRHGKKAVLPPLTRAGEHHTTPGPRMELHARARPIPGPPPLACLCLPACLPARGTTLLPLGAAAAAAAASQARARLAQVSRLRWLSRWPSSLRSSIQRVKSHTGRPSCSARWRCTR